MVVLGTCPICGGEPRIQWNREAAQFGWRYYAKVECACGLRYMTPEYYDTFDKALHAAEDKWDKVSLHV